MTSLSGVRVPFPCTVLPVKATSSCAYDSEMSITTSLVASFAKPFPFLRSSHLRLGSGLVRCSSVSSLGMGVGAALGVDDGAASWDGVCRFEGGDGERRLGGEDAGWLLLSVGDEAINAEARATLCDGEEPVCELMQDKHTKRERHK